MRNLRRAVHWMIGSGTGRASLACIALGAVHCGADDASTFGASDRGEGTGTGSTTASTSGGSGIGTGTGGGGGGPPEVEVEKAFEAPVATERFVWAANPRTGRVALVDAKTYQVKTVAAGEGPTFIAAIPGKDDRAIVLNVLSNDATYFSQQTDGSVDRRTFQVAPGANAWAISGDARFAISWTDVSRVNNPDKIQGFQQISIIDLGTTSAISRAPIRTVGFRPSAVSFSSDAKRAFAVTEDGVTVIDLETAADPKVLRTIKLDVASNVIDAGPNGDGSSAPADGGGSVEAGATDGGADGGVGAAAVTAPVITDPNGGKADVSITPNGQFAVVRREQSAFVTVINLADASRWSWKLSGPVTDLDLSDTGDRAVAVVRDQARVAVLRVPGAPTTPFDDVHIDGETVGSVVLAPQGNTALLFTNAVAVNRLTVLRLSATPSFDVIDLHAPVLSVFASPTGNHAVVVHNPFGGKAFASPGAFSVVPLAGDQAPIIQPTDAPPLSVAISPSGDRALVSVRSDQGRVYGVYLTRMPSLVTERYPLASPPTAAGFVGAEGQAFVAQDHPQGRVTFIDPVTGLVRTITGFELGASVVVWSRDGGQ